MIKYFIFPEKEHNSIVLQREDGSLVVFIEGSDSPEYTKYLAWVAEGNEAESWG